MFNVVAIKDGKPTFSGGMLCFSGFSLLFVDLELVGVQVGNCEGKDENIYGEYESRKEEGHIWVAGRGTVCCSCYCYFLGVLFSLGKDVVTKLVKPENVSFAKLGDFFSPRYFR